MTGWLGTGAIQAMLQSDKRHSELMRQAITRVGETAAQIWGKEQQLLFKPLISPQTKKIFDYLERAERVGTALGASGWLPHPSIPEDLVLRAIDEDNVGIGSVVENYLFENWPAVSAAFARRFEESGIDAESLAATTEALQCRGHNLHRATCRVVFPEIERVARTRLPTANPTKIASLKEVRAAIGSLTPFEGKTPGVLWLTVFNHIKNACYADVSATATIDDFPIPNRHAISHGRVPYSRACDSMNSLVIADFMFSSIDALAARLLCRSEMTDSNRSASQMAPTCC